MPEPVAPGLVEAAARALWEQHRATYPAGYIRPWEEIEDQERHRERARAVLDAVGDALRLEGAQAEHARWLAEVQRRVEHAQRGCESFSDSDYWRGRLEGLAQLRNDERDVASSGRILSGEAARVPVLDDGGVHPEASDG